MTENDIIQQGEKVKYIVTSLNPNFNIEEDDFRVELIYGMMGKRLVIQKSEMMYGTDGKYIMQFSTSGMVGKVVARTVYFVHDADINPDGEREEVDEQIICFVVSTPCPVLLNCPKCNSEGHDIHFERTEESDIAAMYLRLCVTEIVTPESGGEPYIRKFYKPISSYSWAWLAVWV